LWEVSFSQREGKILGNPRPLTVGRGRDLNATTSRDGSRIAFSSVNITGNLEVIPFDADGRGQTGEPRSITSGNDLIYFANFSPDGSVIAFASLRGASSHIWRTDAAGVVQLTTDPNYFDGYPRYSPDGKQIAFARRDIRHIESPLRELWLMEADGANPQPTGIQRKDLWTVFLGFFAWFPTTRELVLQSDSDRQLYRYDFNTRTSRRVTNESPPLPVVSVSPDGKWIIYLSTTNSTTDVKAIRAEGGSSRFVVSTPHEDMHPFVSPLGKWLYFQCDHKNLYRVPGPAQNWIAKEPEKITNFPESGLFLEDPQISHDGKQFLYSRINTTGDLWILEMKN
jgi:Tol biopolymer transport system component